MDAVENVASMHFLEDFNWGIFERVIDVGGSIGAKSLAILKANPKLKATLFDRPQVIEEAKIIWEEKERKVTLDRVNFEFGDMLESIPKAESESDVYLFMAVFHGFGNSDCKKILVNLKAAIGNKSPYVVIIDGVADETNIDLVTASMDMQMLIGTAGTHSGRMALSI